MFTQLLFLAAALLTAQVSGQAQQIQSPSQLPLNLIQLPPGFSISLYTSQSVPSARQLALSDGLNEQYPGAVIVYAGSEAGTVSDSATCRSSRSFQTWPLGLLKVLPSLVSRQAAEPFSSLAVSSSQADAIPFLLAQVSALVDLDGTASNVTVVPLLSNLDAPHGVAWHNASLYVAERRRVTRYDNVDDSALAGQVRLCLFFLRCCWSVI